MSARSSFTTNRFGTPLDLPSDRPRFRSVQSEEALVLDARARLRPAQLVEIKLMSLLKKVLLPVSQIRMTSLLCHGRSHC